MGIVLEPVSFVGVDVGDTQIRVIQLSRAGDRPTLVAAGSINLPTPQELKDKPIADEQLTEKIKQLMSEVGVVTENVVFSLPENEVFTRIIDMPAMAHDEMHQAIQFEAESYVPFPLTEVQLDWQVLEENAATKKTDKVKALLVAAPLKVIDRFVTIMENANLRPLAIETDTVANNRSASLEDVSSGTFGILDIGSRHSVFSISCEGTPRLTHNVPFAGKQITANIAQQLNIQETEAEKLKLGLDKLDEVQRESVTKSFTAILDNILNEIRRSVRFYQGQESGRQLEKLLLTGRGAKLMGINEYFHRNLNLPVETLNPWKAIKTQATLSPKQLTEMAPAFSVALGLALREEK